MTSDSLKEHGRNEVDIVEVKGKRGVPTSVFDPCAMGATIGTETFERTTDKKCWVRASIRPLARGFCSSSPQAWWSAIFVEGAIAARAKETETFRVLAASHFCVFVPLRQLKSNGRSLFAHSAEKHDAPIDLHVLEFRDCVCQPRGPSEWRSHRRREGVRTERPL